MTEIKTEGCQSYGPLTSVNSAYPSTCVRTPNAKKMPMLMKKSLYGESKHDEDSYFDETFDTYICQICDVDVPVLCLKIHNESEKHVTLKNIFQKVLERVSKQINISVIKNTEDLNNQLYYCRPCCKIIKLENILKHESSEFHVNSQRGIDVVHEFYKIFEANKDYVGVKEEENEEFLDEKRNFGTEIIQNDIKNNYVRDVTNEDLCNGDETKTVSSTDTITPTDTIEQLVPNEKQNEALTTEANYVKDVVKKYNLKVNLPIVDGEFIHVANPSGITVKISQDHFHGYRSIVEGVMVYCQLCLVQVDLTEDSEHKISEEHAKNVFLPVNENFGRTLNDYSHCVICNKLVVTSNVSVHYENNHGKQLNTTKITDICQNNEDAMANGINMENIERIRSENHSNKSEVKKINECTNEKKYVSEHNLSENDLDDLNEGGHIGRTKDAPSVKTLVFCKLCNVSVRQHQMEYHNAGSPHWSNVLKNICTGVAEGIQAYFSKDHLKTDNDLSEKQNGTHKNDNVANQNDKSENDDVNKLNDISKNNNVTIENDKLQNDNINNPNDLSKNDNVNNQNDKLKNDNVPTQNDTLKIDYVTKQNDTIKNDNVAHQNDTLKNVNVASQNDKSENDNIIKQNDISKNNNVTKQKDTLQNDNVTKQNDIPKNDNVAKQNDKLKNYDLTNRNDTLKNDNVASQNNKSENDNITKQNDTLQNDNVTISKNNNVTNQNDKLKNGNITKQNNIPQNENVSKQNVIPYNDIVAGTVSNTEIESSRPYRYVDTTKSKVTCIVCDIEIAHVPQSMTKHEATSFHKLWLRKLLNYHTIKENSELSFCECCCDSTVSNIWTHIRTEQHTALLHLEYEINPNALKLYVYKNKERNHHALMFRELYKMMLECNKIYKLPNSNFHCSFCEIELCENGNEIDHMFTAAHEKWLKSVFKSRSP